MALKPGYKQTEAGVIPEDWDAVTVGRLLEFKNGLNKAKGYFGYGTPIINYIDVYQNSGLKEKDVTGKVNVTSEEIRTYSAKKGDVFFTRTSETVDEIGISTVLLEDIQDAVFSGFVLRGRPILSMLDLQFKKYCFNSVVVRKQIKSTSSYTTRALTNGKNLSRIYLPLPPTKTEQTAIANALSDADALIQSLTRLIAKKRQIKQGAMQTLLNPYENGHLKAGWVVKKLGDICENITTGRLDANAMIENGEYSFFTCAKQVYRINHFAFNYEALLVSGNGANVGYIHYFKGKFNAYQRTYVLSGFKCDVHYLKVFMERNLQNRIKVEVNAGNTPYIVMGTLTGMDVLLPENETEQTRIATILSDMDAEIAALETKLAKYRQIKQGMMQNLLTGRIRLVKPESKTGAAA